MIPRGGGQSPGRGRDTLAAVVLVGPRRGGGGGGRQGTPPAMMGAELVRLAHSGPALQNQTRSDQPSVRSEFNLMTSRPHQARSQVTLSSYVV